MDISLQLIDSSLESAPTSEKLDHDSMVLFPGSQEQKLSQDLSASQESDNDVFACEQSMVLFSQEEKVAEDDTLKGGSELTLGRVVGRLPHDDTTKEEIRDCNIKTVITSLPLEEAMEDVKSFIEQAANQSNVVTGGKTTSSSNLQHMQSQSSVGSISSLEQKCTVGGCTSLERRPTLGLEPKHTVGASSISLLSYSTLSVMDDIQAVIITTFKLYQLFNSVLYFKLNNMCFIHTKVHI